MELHYPENLKNKTSKTIDALLRMVNSCLTISSSKSGQIHANYFHWVNYGVKSTQNCIALLKCTLSRF